jgi:cytochrome P450
VITDESVPDFPMPRQHPLDPPPLYRTLTAQRPVIRVRTARDDVAWLVTGYEDVKAVLTDPRFGSDPRTPGFPTYLTGNLEPPPGFFMQFDAPDHGRLRRTVSREFIVNRMEELRPGMARVLDELIDDMAGHGTAAELVADLALPMSARVICDLLGVPYGDTSLVKTNVDVLLDRASAPARVQRAASTLTGYFDGLITDKERHPATDVLGRLVANAADGRLTHDELIGMAQLLLLGGYDTLVQMIGLGVLALLEHPGQLAALRADPSLVPGAVEELLRVLTVNHAGLPRVALADVTVAGQLIRAHEGVLVMLNAANRDPGAFKDPDTLDIRRAGPAHVAFGWGLHKCVGIALARVELQTVFTGLFRRLPALRLARPIDELDFRHEMVLYGVRELPVTWGTE